MLAQAGIHDFLCCDEDKSWIPACAGMTGVAARTSMFRAVSIRLSARVGRDGEPYALAHVAANAAMSATALYAIQTAVAHRLTIGGLDRVVVIEGEIESTPRFYGAPALVAEACVLHATILERGTVRAPSDLDV